MKSQSIVALLAVCVLSLRCAFAFPSQAEIKTATDVVGDLVADDIRAANAGKLKREDVAGKLVGLVDRAESDAAKWVLYKHAFIQYAKAGNFEKAGEVLSDMVSLFPDVPPQTVIALIDKNCAKANAKNAPVVVKMRKLMLLRQKCGGVVANAKASKKEKAEACCLMGDWAKGLKMFADVGGKPAEMAAAETSGSQPKHVVANFWWDYKSDLDTCDQFKAHAAEIYKAGLEDDSISGLYKDIAEKRIAEMEAVPTVEFAPKADVPYSRAKGLAHRWSFAKDLRDSVGKSTGKSEGSVTFKNGMAVLPGGSKTAGAINLGNNLISGDRDFTLEIWASLNHIYSWTTVFRIEYPGEKTGSHSIANQCRLNWNVLTRPDTSCFVAPYKEYQTKGDWEINKPYHIVLVGKKEGDGRFTYVCMRAMASDQEFFLLVSHTGAPLPSKTLGLWLGRCLYGKHDDGDAAATYDEVRIWDRALTQEELNKSHKCGPNKLF